MSALSDARLLERGALAVRQGSEAWLAARRSLVTASDIPILLGLSPYRCEADLAAEKLGADGQDTTLRMRVGLALEPLIAEEYERQSGRKLRRFHGLRVHRSIEWAGASPDYGVVGERRLVETKWTGSRSRFTDGLPADVEAQCAWQLMVMDYDVADVAALLGGEELRTFTVERNVEMERGLVDIAADFRARLEAGGPFAQSADSLKRRYPADNGGELVADPELEEAVTTLVALRAAGKAAEEQQEVLETAIKTRMAEASTLVGNGWRVTWKRTKDVETIDWKSVADGLLRQLPEHERIALVGIATNVRAGGRPFRVVTTKED